MSGKKDDIIEEALRLIALEGAQACTTKTISKNVGCSEALVYKYFPSKEALFEGCLSRINELNQLLVTQVVPAAAQGQDSPVDLIRSVTRAYLRFHIEHWTGTLAFEHFSKSIFTEEMKQQFAQGQTEYIGYLTNLLGIGAAIQKFEGFLPFGIWWQHMLDVTAFFVRKVKEGVITEDEHTYQMYFDLLFNGLRDSSREAL